MATIPKKFYKYSVNGVPVYEALPSYNTPRGYQETSIEEAQAELGRVQANPKKYSDDYLGALQQGVRDVQSGTSPYVTNDQGVLATQQEVAAQQAQQAEIASGEAINVGTQNAPLTVPKGTPTPEEANKKFQANQPPPTYQEYNPKTGEVKTVTPQPGSGKYIEDVTKGFQQQTSGITAQDYQLKPGETTEQYHQRIAQLKGGTSGTPTTPPPAVQTSDALRTQTRKEELDAIKTEMEAGANKPAPFKSLEEFDKLRADKGVVKDEEELQSLQQESMLAQQEMRQFRSTAGQGVSEGGRIGAVSEAERNLSFRLEGLAIREQAVLNRLNTKNAYIKTALDLGSDDYKTAYTDYTNEYNKNVKAIDALNDKMDDQKKDALTGITTVVNLLKDKGGVVDPAIKAQLDTLSLQAGLPAGLVEQAISTAPNDKIQTVTGRTDAQGNEFFDVLKVKPDGSLYVQTVATGKGKPPTDDTPQTIKSGGMIVSESDVSKGQAGLDVSRGSDGYANTKLYADLLEGWKNDLGLEQDFFKYYPPKQYLNPNDSSVPKYIRDMLKQSDEETLF